MQVLIFWADFAPSVHKTVQKMRTCQEREAPWRRTVMAGLIQRGKVWYIQYCVSGKARRVSTGTDSEQIAKEKLRQFESSQFRGDDSPLPTRAPIAQAVET
jgi:hypothetical protein